MAERAPGRHHRDRRHYARLASGSTGCGTGSGTAKSAVRGHHPLRPLAVPDPHRRPRWTTFDPTDHMEERRARRIDRFGQFSVAASRMALEDAKLDLAREDSDRVGVMMGTALGGVGDGGGAARPVRRRGRPGRRSGAGADGLCRRGELQRRHRVRRAPAPTSTNGMSCASGTIAIGDAFRAIVRGDADVMLAGGAEAPLAPLSFGAFAIIRAMSTRNDDPGHRQPALRRRPRRLRDGRGRGGARARGAAARAGAGRTDLRRALWVRTHQ